MSKRNLSPLLCGSALLSLTFGTSLFYIEQQFSYLATTLVTMGGMVLLVLFGLIIRYSFSQNHNIERGRGFSFKRWKKLVTIFCVVTASIAFVGTSHYLANNSEVRWDITQNKQHTLSKNSVEYISTLSK